MQICTAAAALWLPAVSPAAVITKTITVTGTGFVPYASGAAAPYPVLSATFNITFDPTVLVYSSTSGISVTSFTPSNFGSLTPCYDNQPQFYNDALTIGGSVKGTSLNTGFDDYEIFIYNFTTTPTLNRFSYSAAGYSGSWDSSGGTVIAATPEPSLLAGLLIVAAGSRLRRR